INKTLIILFQVKQKLDV
ncbi:unnamed protein product, partial [Rotaria sordida]